MNRHIKKNLCLLPALIAAVGGMLTGRLPAQMFTSLHYFSMPMGFQDTNTDGRGPEAGVVLSGDTLYGTASSAGYFGNGTVFAVNRDGTGFTNLYNFTLTTTQYAGPNADGAFPYGGLVASDNTLYGVALQGGSSGNGTVFRLDTDGGGFTNLHSFAATMGISSTNNEGAFPRANLILAGQILYGTAGAGGTSGNGTVFALNADGTGFTNLHNFPKLNGPYPATNNDGAYPRGHLVLSGNILYGAASSGGSFGFGTLFKVNIDGSGFTNFHSFAARDPLYSTNSEGVAPVGGLVLSGNTLYGVTQYGGKSDQGTIFTINTDGSGFTNWHNFNGTATNGTSPYSGLVLGGNTLYGTTPYGGSSGSGTIFQIKTDGSGFTNRYNFKALTGPLGNTNSDGYDAFATPILSGDTLYGTAFYGGYYGYGSVFSLTLPGPPELVIMRFETNVVLSWPTNAPGFNLQSTTDLTPPIVWTLVSPTPVVVSGRNGVTNSISATQKFYRLTQ
jgi:uncharacterized repeat protein (TIGR03803 family)